MSDRITTYKGTVYPWHCDHVGHMNVMWYVGKFDEATWNLFRYDRTDAIIPAGEEPRHGGSPAEHHLQARGARG